MDTGNAAMEIAERRIEQERDATVARVRSELSGPAGGFPFCGCGAAIPEARRQALPHATTCVDCAKEREARKR